MHKPHFFVPFFIGVCLAACSKHSGTAPTTPPDGVEVRLIAPAEARAALSFVVEKTRNVHPETMNGFSTETEKALLAAMESVGRTVSSEQLGFILNRCLVTLHDAHVEVRYRDDAGGHSGCVDLPLSWRPQGLIVTRDAGSLMRGDRIVSIARLDESSLLAELRRVIPVENEYRLKYLGASRLQRGDYLHMLGAVEGDSVAIDVETMAGERRQLALTLDVCAAAVKDTPWVGFDIHDDEALGVFWFDRFEYNREMVDTMEAFFEQVEERGIDKIAIDLRNKTGGDSTVAFAFLEHFADVEYESFSVDIRISDELSTMVPAFDPRAVSPWLVEAGLPAIGEDATHYVLPGPLVRAAIGDRMTLRSPGQMHRVSDRRIYMLVDAGTFSSGNLFAILLRDNGIGTLVGEPTGNRINFNGSELQFDIPGTDYYLNLSTATMRRPDAARGDGLAIKPDVLVVTTRDDIAAGRDPQLAYLKTR